MATIIKENSASIIRDAKEQLKVNGLQKGAYSQFNMIRPHRKRINLRAARVNDNLKHTYTPGYEIFLSYHCKKSLPGVIFALAGKKTGYDFFLYGKNATKEVYNEWLDLVSRISCIIIDSYILSKYHNVSNIIKWNMFSINDADGMDGKVMSDILHSAQTYNNIIILF